MADLPGETPGRAGPGLITASRVLLGDGGAIDDAAVVIENGQITSVAPRHVIGRGPWARADRFQDGCLVPGFIDAHVHLCFRHEADLAAGSPALHENPAAVAVSAACHRLLQAGVTSVRDLGSVGRVVQDARDAVATGEMEGPRIWCAGRPVTAPHGHLSSFGIPASGEAGLAAAVRAASADGIDTVKLVATGGAGTPGTPLGRAQFTTSEMRTAVSVAAEAGLTVSAHAHGTEGIARAVAAGVHTIEHCSWMDRCAEVTAPDPAVLATMRRRGQVAVIAGPIPREMAQRLASGSAAAVGRNQQPETAPMRRTLAIWRNALASREHGVVHALGSDSMFGQFPDHHDLAWRAQGLVELAGWPEHLVLEALWQGGAKALATANGTIGRIGPGAPADLVVLGDDPAAGIRALHDVRAVFRSGRRVTLAAAAIQAT